MKKILFIATCLCFFTLLVNAQQQAKISEEIRSMSKGSNPCLVMELPGNNIKTVRKEWESFVKGYKGKTSYHKGVDEVFADDARIKEMSENTVDIYAKVVAKDPETLELIVWYNLGITYLSSNTHAQGIPIAEAMLREFSKDIFIELLKEQLENKEKEMKDLAKALKSLEKERSGFDKTIAGYEEDIKKIQDKVDVVEEKVDVNVETQAKQKATIEEQQKLMLDIERQIETLKKSKKK